MVLIFHTYYVIHQSIHELDIYLIFKPILIFFMWFFQLITKTKYYLRSSSVQKYILRIINIKKIYYHAYIDVISYFRGL